MSKFCVVIRFEDDNDVFAVVTGFETEEAAIAWIKLFSESATEKYLYTVMQPIKVSEIELSGPRPPCRCQSCMECLG